MIRVAVTGAAGRMGSRILNLALRSEDFKVMAAFEHPKSEYIGMNLGVVSGDHSKRHLKVSVLGPASLKDCDVVIDFTSPQCLSDTLSMALKSKSALVIGTTGLDSRLEQAVVQASKKIAILYSPNMSLGANFLFELAKMTARTLKSGYDIEIIEAHHRLKKDAPSGTAKKLAQVIAKEKGWDLSRAAKYGRQGFTGERSDNEIGIHAVRAGDIVGDHKVIFSGSGETIALSHQAQSRDAFARGALTAALFITKKKKGLYTMADVLGLK